MSLQAFLSGTVTSGVVLSNAVPEVFGSGITTNAVSALAAGALVGFGTQLGSGWYVKIAGSIKGVHQDVMWSVELMNP